MKRIRRRVTEVAAVVLSAVLGLVVACGSPTTDVAGPPTTLGPGENIVSVLAWPGYVESGQNDPQADWVTPFEKQSGCRVKFTSFGTSDDAVALMRTGKYDVVSASGDASRRLMQAGDVAPINTSLIPNYPDLYGFLKNKPWNSLGGTVYGVPHGWGANLLMYRTDVVKPAPTSWRAVFDDASRYAGRVTAYDSPIYIADAALYLMRHRPDLHIVNPYALDRRQLAAAVSLLRQQRRSIGEYWNDVTREAAAFGGGWSVVGTAWQVAAVLARDAGAPVATVLPEEGSTGWSDSWMVGARAAHPTCAYRWIDYIVSPEANAKATEYFGESPANPLACGLFRNKEHCAEYHSSDADYASRIWYWSTPTADCLDGRTDVTCADYAAWTKAWMEVKG